MRGAALVRVLGWTVGVVSLVFMVVVLIRTWQETQEHVLPHPWQWVLAALLVPWVSVCSATGWVWMFDGAGDRRVLAHSFYAAQLTKYVPGGVLQVVSQVGLSARAGVTASHATAMFPVYAIVGVVCTGGTYAVLLGLFDSSQDLWLRVVLLLAGVGAMALLHRHWMVLLFDGLHGRWERIPSGEIVPGQRALFRAYGIAVLAFLFNGLAFTLLVNPSGGFFVWLEMIAAFGVAFTVGFLVLPVPSGAGVREATLLLLVGDRVEAATLIAAALVFRLVFLIAADGLVAAASTARLRMRGRPGSDADVGSETPNTYGREGSSTETPRSAD